MKKRNRNNRKTLFKTYKETLYKFIILTASIIISLITSMNQPTVMSDGFYIAVFIQSLSNFYDVTSYIGNKKYTKGVNVKSSIICISSSITALISFLCLCKVKIEIFMYLANGYTINVTQIIIMLLITIYPMILLFEGIYLLIRKDTNEIKDYYPSLIAIGGK